MKTLPPLIAYIIASTVLAHSQNEKIPTPRVATPAHILGNIPDGTPPLPAPPKPTLVVAKADILSTSIHQQGGRTITIREIKPIDLPEPPQQASASAAMDPAVREHIADYHATHPKDDILYLGATIYRSKNSPPRTLVRYNPMGAGENCTFWSSADFSLIAGGIHSFLDSAGQTHSIFMSWENIDIDSKTDPKSTQSYENNMPEIPEFPEGMATWQITGKPPTDTKALIPIQSLHDIYNKEHDRLLEAYEGRERARIKEQAYLKAHPPKPKNITLNYWRTKTPTATTKGENK